MENMTIQSFGAAAGVLMMSYWFIQNGPSWIRAIKGEDRSPPIVVEESNVTDDMRRLIDDIKEVINNNTQASNKLVNYLDKSEAIRIERDKQVFALLENIAKEQANTNKKIDDVYNIVNVHATKCDATCRSQI